MFDRILRALTPMLALNEQQRQDLLERRQAIREQHDQRRKKTIPERRQELLDRLHKNTKAEEVSEDIIPVDYLSGAVLGHEHLLTIMAQMLVAGGLATTDDLVEQLRALPSPTEDPNHPDFGTGYNETMAKFLSDMRRHG